MLTIVQLIDYLDEETKAVGESEMMTPTGQANKEGYLQALKQFRSFISKNTLLANNENSQTYSNGDTE